MKKQLRAAILLGLMFSGISAGGGIDIISSTVHVKGAGYESSYEDEGIDTCSGSCTGTTPDGSTWEASSEGSISAGSASLHAASGLTSGPAYDLWFGYSQVTIHCVFRPLVTDLEFSFSGSTWPHFFENYCKYDLVDTTIAGSPVGIDSRRWAYDAVDQIWVYDALPYSSVYNLQPDHINTMTLYALSTVGDQRYGEAELNLTIIPEPVSMLLLSLGGLVLARRKQRSSDGSR